MPTAMPCQKIKTFSVIRANGSSASIINGDDFIPRKFVPLRTNGSFNQRCKTFYPHPSDLRYFNKFTGLCGRYFKYVCMDV